MSKPSRRAMNGMFCKRCEVGRINNHYGVSHCSVPCRPLLVIKTPHMRKTISYFYLSTDICKISRLLSIYLLVSKHITKKGICPKMWLILRFREAETRKIVKYEQIKVRNTPDSLAQISIQHKPPAQEHIDNRIDSVKDHITNFSLNRPHCTGPIQS